MSTWNEDRIGRIVQVAKRGTTGEKQAARHILKKICEKHGLDYETLMSDEEKLQEFRIKVKRTHRALASHIMYKYAFPLGVERNVYTYRWSGELGFTTTMEKYVEAINAFEVLGPLFDKEITKVRKAVYFGFLEKHDLFFERREDEPEQESKKRMSAEEIAARKRGSALAEDMEDAHLVKRIGTKKA